MFSILRCLVPVRSSSRCGRVALLLYKSCVSQVSTAIVFVDVAAFLCFDVRRRSNIYIDVVMLSDTSPSPPCSPRTCYFSIAPPSYSHFSTETPCYSPHYYPIETSADPNNPLLAYRDPQDPSYAFSPTTSTLSTLLQMQTAVAHGHQAIRPRPYPIQNVLHVNSDDSVSSDDSASSTDSTNSSLDLARCSRCRRTPSIHPQTGKSNMVQYGLNSWYCSRCASLVGLVNR